MCGRPSEEEAKVAAEAAAEEAAAAEKDKAAVAKAEAKEKEAKEKAGTRDGSDDFIFFFFKIWVHSRLKPRRRRLH